VQFREGHGYSAPVADAGEARASLEGRTESQSQNDACHGLMSFLPRRLRTVPQGTPENRSTSIKDSETRSELRAFPAAVLMLDICGFSGLCESYSEAGSVGCECFALTTSRFLTALVGVIEEHGGDVDAFAGDALIALFQPQCPPKTEHNAPSTDGLALAVVQAIRCAERAQKLDYSYKLGFETLPVTLHAAVSAGSLWSLTADGILSSRTEAFTVGHALSELSTALGKATSSEIVAAPSAWELITRQWQGEPMGGGCYRVITAPSRHCRSHTSPDSTAPRREPQLSALPACAEPVPSSSGQQPRPISQQECMRYLPGLVVSKIQAGIQMNYVAEHRLMTVMFLVQQTSASYLVDNPAEIHALQRQLGLVIDVVETQWNGFTRQIIFDDKGLTAIFVFGQSGVEHEDHPIRAVLAALAILTILGKDSQSTRWHAGLSAGPCFCGTAGDITKRCEYVIMGDAVVTAARVAGQAVKRKEKILCSDALQKAMQKVLVRHCGLRMSHAGSVCLKGKRCHTVLYVPELKDLASAESSDTEDQKEGCSYGRVDTDVTRKAECKQVFESICHMLSDDPNRQRLLIIEADPGMGKRAVVDCILKWVTATMARRRSSHSGIGLFRSPGLHRLPSECGSSDSSFCRIVHIAASSVELGVPFLACHRIFTKLALLSGDDKDILPVMFFQREDEWTTDDLPAYLQPYSQELHHIQAVPRDQRTVALVPLYLQLILTALKRQASKVLIIVEDVQFLDPLSWRVLTAPELVHGDKDGSARRAVVFTSRSCGDHNSSSLTGYRALRQHRGTNLVVLPPIGDRLIVSVAERSLGGHSLSPPLKAFITGCSDGKPFYAQEIVAWLKEHNHVATGKDGVVYLLVPEEEIGIPPSLVQIIQARLGHLPHMYIALLQCASVLGRRFLESHAYTLLSTMTQRTSKNSVHRALSKMEKLQLLVRVTGESPPDPHGYNTEWQFCHRLDTEVAYGMLLHRHRKDLHRVAAQLLQKEADQEEQKASTASAKDREALLFTMAQQEALADHWVCGLEGTTEARHSFHATCRKDAASLDASQPELLQAAAALEKLLVSHFNLGYDLKRSPTEYLNTLHDISTHLAEEACSLSLKLRTLQRHSLHLELQACHPDTPIEEARRLRNQAQLFHAAAMKIPKEEDNGKQCSNILEGSWHYDSLFSKIVVENAGGGAQTLLCSVDPREMEAALQALGSTNNSPSTAAAQSYAGHYCSILRFWRGDFTAAAEHASAGHAAWQRGGRFEMLNGLQVQHGMHLTALWRMCDLLGHGTMEDRCESAMALQKELEAAHIQGPVLLQAHACLAMAEALWEPLTSVRVARHLEAAGAVMCNGGSASRDMESAAWLLGLGQLRLAALLAPVSEPTAAFWSDKVYQVLETAKRGGPMAYLIPVAAKLFAHEAIRVAPWGQEQLGSELVKPKARLSRCCEGLRHCLGLWQSCLKVLGEEGGTVFMPASFQYCQAVLLRLERMAAESVRQSASSVHEGIRDTVSHLLAAQRLAMAAASDSSRRGGASKHSPEPLSAGLPAALALCHLLLSRAARPGRRHWCLQGRRRWKVTVPKDLPRGPSALSPGRTEEVLVLPGSTAAKEWVHRSLSVLLTSMTQPTAAVVDGSNPSPFQSPDCLWWNARSPEAVHDSDYFHEAVCLWREAGSPQVSDTSSDRPSARRWSLPASQMLGFLSLRRRTQQSWPAEPGRSLQGRIQRRGAAPVHKLSSIQDSVHSIDQSVLGLPRLTQAGSKPAASPRISASTVSSREFPWDV